MCGLDTEWGILVAPLDLYVKSVSLTFSGSLLPIILCLLSQKKKQNYAEILKTKKFLTEEENAKGREHKSIFTFKMAFLECVQTVVVFLLPQAVQRVINYAYKRKVSHSQY